MCVWGGGGGLDGAAAVTRMVLCGSDTRARDVHQSQCWEQRTKAFAPAASSSAWRASPDARTLQVRKHRLTHVHYKPESIA